MKKPDRRWIAYESLAPAGERTVTETDDEGTVTAYVLKEARLLGLVSKNERTYLMPDAKLYEGAKVNIDHPDWMQGTKSQNDKMGFVRNAKAVEGKGIFGDIVMNPEHPRAKQHLWDAENDPNNQGFSHVAINERADVSEASDGGPVYTVVEVISVDLVGRPATTNGMFEQQESTVNEKELREEIARLKTALAEAEKNVGVAEQALSEEQKSHETTKREHAEGLVKAEREALLEGIDGEIKDSFRKAVLGAESVEAAKELIESIRPVNKPKSNEQKEAPKGKGDEQKTYEQIAESGGLDYRKVK